jgi:uncharacterized membrane protein YozB (DUF420 family)
MEEKQLHELIKNSFHLSAEPTRGPERQPGNEFAHDTKLVVIDVDGHIRGYFDGMRDSRANDPDEEYQTNLKRLRRLVNHLAFRPSARYARYLPQDFPLFNATLNAFSAVLLVVGYAFIRARNIRLHVSCMVMALLVSTLFLASYLYYHLVVKGGRPTPFQEEALGAPEWVRYVYLVILASHTLLAAVTAPMALYVAYQGLRGRLARHVRLARWTLPIWLYVSITGVVVYWMLYRLYPGA